MGEPYGGVETGEEGKFKGKSQVSFHHAFILAADEAHRAYPGAIATVEYEIVLGSNPPITEYRVIITTH
jgi:hypothetical protein